MHLTLMTDSLGQLPFEEMLDTAAMLQIETLEIPTGGYSSAPHMINCCPAQKNVKIIWQRSKAGD